MRHLVTATIRPGSPRAAAWREIFGGETVPIESPSPHRGSAPGHPSAEFYRLAAGALDWFQRERLIAHLAMRFGADPAIVAADIHGEHGVPILAEDVVVGVDARAFL